MSGGVVQIDGIKLLDDDVHAAARLGLTVVVATDRDIFVDLDANQDQYVLEANLTLLRKNGFEVDFVKTTRSRSGNKHVYLRAPRVLTDVERIALQAILGSDRKREVFCFLRILAGTERPVSVFFEKPDEVS